MRFLLLLGAAAVCACGSHDGRTDAATVAQIEVEPAFATLTVPLGTTATQDYVVYGVTATGRRDITSECTLAIDSNIGTFTDATVTVFPVGGKTAVTAMCSGITGAAQLAINVTGDVVMPPAPASAPGLFGSATSGSDAARTPLIEYPLDGAVSPRNMPPIEVQWTAAGNDLYRVHVTSTFLDINIYTTSVDTLMTDADWGAVLSSSTGDNVAFVVEGLAQAAPATKYASAPVTLRIARDSIDQTAIYYWASSQQKIFEQTFGAKTPPNQVKDRCTSCHSVNRTSTRIGYSRCLTGCGAGDLWAGFLKYDATTKTWVESVNADSKIIEGSYTTFAPVGNPFPTDAQSVAIVAMKSPARLSLWDPDTGAPVTSNIETQSEKGPGGTRSATMPDWSPDGNKVVYASTPYAGQWIDLRDSRIATMTYSYQNNQHVFGDPQFLIPDPITLQNGTYNNFFFPSYSPDGALIVFNAARQQWRTTTSDARDPGQRLMLADANGAWVTDLPAVNGGYVDIDITWPHWAPTVGTDYYWIVFSSQRDYGHRVTEALSPTSCKGNGVRTCKQMWIGSIARNRLTGQVTVDPSAPPMWLPGQDIQADNISPYWSRPTGIQ